MRGSAGVTRTNSPAVNAGALQSPVRWPGRVVQALVDLQRAPRATRSDLPTQPVLQYGRRHRAGVDAEILC